MTENPTTRRTDSNLLPAALAALGLALVASLVAAAPAPPCFDKANRYADCGNGTVKDSATGLVWLQTADCIGRQDFETANQSAAALAEGECNLKDGSQPKDWRLPTKTEWEATIAPAVAMGCKGMMTPSLTNDPGTACLSEGPSAFRGVRAEVFWSSTSGAGVPASAWAVGLGLGETREGSQDSTLFVWPVRGGTQQ